MKSSFHYLSFSFYRFIPSQEDKDTVSLCVEKEQDEVFKKPLAGLEFLSICKLDIIRPG